MDKSFFACEFVADAQRKIMTQCHIVYLVFQSLNDHIFGNVA